MIPVLFPVDDEAFLAEDGVQVGQVLHNTYKILRRIAEGGMGIVYEAEHVRLGSKRVAVKILNAKVMSNPVVYTRFRREAEIVAELGHPNIVYMMDFNELPSGQPYMVMEYLEGEDLETRLDRVEKLAPDQVIQLIEQVGSALQVVHERGIVHRDLKPQNILLIDTPNFGIQIKILDFGISKIRGSKSMVTQDESVIGTPMYMSPEQARGEIQTIDHRTDIFALGTIAYQVLSGILPFDAPNIPGVLFNVCYTTPPPLSEIITWVSSDIDDVLARALAKDPNERYQQVEQFVGDFNEILAHGEATRVDSLPYGADLFDTDPQPPRIEQRQEEEPAAAAAEPEEPNVSVAEDALAEMPTENIPVEMFESAVTEVEAPLEQRVTEERRMGGTSPKQTTLISATGERPAVRTVDISPYRRYKLLLAAGVAALIILTMVAVVLIISRPHAPRSAMGPTESAAAQPLAPPVEQAAPDPRVKAVSADAGTTSGQDMTHQGRGLAKPFRASDRKRSSRKKPAKKEPARAKPIRKKPIRKKLVRKKPVRKKPVRRSQPKKKSTNRLFEDI